MDDNAIKREGKKPSLEAQALARFKEVAAVYYPDGWFTGWAFPNRIPQANTGFQFGDLRVDVGTHHVVVEVESAGGVTNLTKYWYLLDTGLVSKPIILFHIFAQASSDDYRSHLDLWDFLAARMRGALGDKVQAVRYTYRNHAELEQVVRVFEDELKRAKKDAD